MPVIYGKKSKASEGDGYSEDGGSDSQDGMAKDNSEDSPTALLPKSVIENKKVSPGDQIILEVVHVYEDEVEVKYGKKEDESDAEDKAEGGEENESQMDMSQRELDNMAGE